MGLTNLHLWHMRRRARREKQRADRRAKKALDKAKRRNAHEGTHERVDEGVQADEGLRDSAESEQELTIDLPAPNSGEGSADALTSGDGGEEWSSETCAKRTFVDAGSDQDDVDALD